MEIALVDPQPMGRIHRRELGNYAMPYRWSDSAVTSTSKPLARPVIGDCVRGSHYWIKRVDGYRCAAGGHFVSDLQLGL